MEYMGATSGIYGLICGDELRGVRVDYDAYPASLGATLASEVAQINPSYKDRLGEQFASITWVTEDDYDLVEAGIAPPVTHPDGHSDVYGQRRTLETMVPRVDYDTMLENGYSCPNPRVFPKPSFTELGLMETATKALPWDDQRLQWLVTVDLDTDEFQIWDVRSGCSPNQLGELFVSIDLDNKDGLDLVAEHLRWQIGEDEASLDVPEELINKRSKRHGRPVRDGMWKRPDGYPPFPNDPSSIVTDSAAPPIMKRTSGKCGSTKTVDGTPCQHKVVGSTCAAGHTQ